MRITEEELFKMNIQAGESAGFKKSGVGV